MTDEEKAEGKIKATYPEFTVFIYEENGKITRVDSFDYYAKRNKTYEECLDKLQTSKDWRCVQNSDLYQVTEMLEKQKCGLKCLADFTERISMVSEELDEIVIDMKEEAGEDL